MINTPCWWVDFATVREIQRRAPLPRTVRAPDMERDTGEAVLDVAAGEVDRARGRALDLHGPLERTTLLPLQLHREVELTELLVWHGAADLSADLDLGDRLLRQRLDGDERARQLAPRHVEVAPHPAPEVRACHRP
jgi:hypothetical protein